jgi:hypothetical protein
MQSSHGLDICHALILPPGKSEAAPQVADEGAKWGEEPSDARKSRHTG